ncbi:MAG TPA: hypothetical protein PKA98_10670, partial [Acidimicrobiales bacterium]|nr:hypothetical protein [Acidimicrobiales bacterium]
VDRLRAERGTGDFTKVHAAPRTSDDVADDDLARLVVLPPESPHIARAAESPARLAALELLERRGNVPRQYKNMLVFAAADQRRLEDLERAAAEYLAWKGILDRSDDLVVSTQQLKHAEAMMRRSNEAIDLRLAETYQWVLVPRQPDPVGGIELEEVHLDAQGTVAQRASRKLISEGALAVQFPAQVLRSKLDRELAPLWENGHVALRDLWQAFAKYVYLPRLRDVEVLVAAAEAGPALLTWQTDGFATAVAVGDGARYLGLATSSHPGKLDPTALLVNPAFALGQIEQEASDQPDRKREDESGGDDHPAGDGGNGDDSVPRRPPTRFTGVVQLDPSRPSRDFGRVAQEVIEHLTALVGADVDITVEVRAKRDDGLPDEVVRTVMENARTLKFDRYDLD